MTRASESGPPRAKRVLAIAGSLRKESWNLRLLETAAAHAPAGLEILVHRELTALPMFDEDLEAATGGGPPAVRSLRDAVAAADGLLIATPEYNQSMPGVLKNAIDWLSRETPDELLVAKPIAIVGASAGRWGTRLAQLALRQTLFACEALVLPSPALFIRDAAQVFAPDGRLDDVATLASLEAVLASFGRWIDCVAPKGMDPRHQAAAVIVDEGN